MTKKTIYLTFLSVSLMGQLGLVFWVDSIYKAYVMMFIIGLSWPGKREIGLSYILEFITEDNKQVRIFILNLLDYPSLMLLALSY